MMLAIGRLAAAESDTELGTVFAVTDRLALTAFHCVGDRRSGSISRRRVRCKWGASVSYAAVQDGDHFNDVVLLRLERGLPSELAPVPLVREVDAHTPFVAPGAPAEIQGMPLYAASGEISWPYGHLDDESPVIQLHCPNSAAGLSLHGLSGAPVLVGNPLRAVGVIRWNPPRADQPRLAAGATVVATPITEVLRQWPALDLGADGDLATLTTLLRHVASRDSDRDDNTVHADVRQLLLTAGIGLHEQHLRSSVGAAPRYGHQIDIETAATVVDVSADLRKRGAVRTAEERLARDLTSRSRRTGQRYVGVMTDGAEWRVYYRSSDALHQLTDANLIVDTSSPDVAGVLSWLESLLATDRRIKPTPDAMERKLGANSPSYLLDFGELRAIYDRYRDRSTVKVKRAMWAKLLTTASGSHFVDDDWLFVNHTLLVAMAEVIGHAILGFEPESPRVKATEIMSGALLTEAQIGGVIEADFFDWIAHVPGGQRFVKNLARRLTRFAWGEVDHDILKVLYESIIPQEVRHRLGEYYTPDWLAECVIDECVTDPLHQRILDASCGSGTFLFHTIRRYIAAAEAEKRPPAEIIRDVGEHVIGFDVHPVAVTLARVTYLLALGMSRLRDEERPAFSVPVYLADSLRWGEEKTLWSDDGLDVPTTLDPQTFVTDPKLTPVSPASQLSFPDTVIANVQSFDQLVSELADRATKRRRKSPVPSLATIFQRLEVRREDQSVLERTFAIMCKLHDNDEDHIWGYYVRNLARPVWLARPDNRVDVILGNPPWLAYRFMTDRQKVSFREMNKQRKLWVGASVATNQDLSALFVSRCIELYLRPGGRFGYVMPLATLTRRQYEGFRTGHYPIHGEPVTVAFDQPWDLHQIKPKFFPQAVGVVFGTRRNSDTGPTPLTHLPKEWSGRFNTRIASLAEAIASTTRTTAEPRPPRRDSMYATRFCQGATVVPRLLFVVEQEADGPLGAGANRRTVHSLRSPFEDKRWKDLPSLRGTVERRFLRPLYVGSSILPFRRLPHPSAVIPHDGHSLMEGTDERLDLYPGLATWWRTAEKVWNRNRTSDRTLLEQLDYRRKLSQQFPTPQYRVVYNKSGTYLAAAIVSDQTAIIDHLLYWGPAANHDEARFLTAILNSTTLTTAVRPLQARGEHNPRHYDKYIFQLPIPVYDATNANHQQLVVLAEQAEQIAGDVDLPAVRFERQRDLVREALVEGGVTADIDAIVKALLT
jgi:N-6 DNA Methylase